MSELKNRFDFVYLFDVQDGNPNGDPDAGNLPRIDAETGMGLVTDVCLKRKVRNYVQTLKQCAVPYDIFVRSKEISGVETYMNEEIAKMYNENGVNLQSGKDADGKKRNYNGKAQGSEEDKGRILMCNKYYDIRTFGAVMSTGPNAGQVRGPIQLTFARSVSPIVAANHSISVSAARDTDKTYKEQIGIQGRKATVPYGLYVCHGFVSANLAQQTGFSEEDLQLFWDAMKHMFDDDRSAAHGLMSAQRLIVFKHDSKLGNAPANKLFDLVNIEKKDPDKVARSFNDYKITVGQAPAGVTIQELI
jgi:CRISPR-associated protein Csd2